MGTHSRTGGLIVGSLDVRAALLGPLADRFDLVAMDPRGIGKSTPVYCDDPALWLALLPLIAPPLL